MLRIVVSWWEGYYTPCILSHAVEMGSGWNLKMAVTVVVKTPSPPATIFECVPGVRDLQVRTGLRLWQGLSQLELTTKKVLGRLGTALKTIQVGNDSLMSYVLTDLLWLRDVLERSYSRPWCWQAPPSLPESLSCPRYQTDTPGEGESPRSHQNIQPKCDGPCDFLILVIFANIQQCIIIMYYYY